MYEPEQFPAIIFRVPNAYSVLIFASGKGILAGVLVTICEYREKEIR